MVMGFEWIGSDLRRVNNMIDVDSFACCEAHLPHAIDVVLAAPNVQCVVVRSER